MHVDSNWSDDQEKVLAAIHISCTIYAEHHKKRYFYLKGYLKYFRIPTIIISGISSVSSVGLQPYLAQNTISMMTCVFALLCGIITSIELYLQIQSSMENELVASKDFYLLAADIYKVLTLSRENRGFGGNTYLDEKFGIFCKYIESSHLINHRIRDTLRFADQSIRQVPTGVERSTTGTGTITPNYRSRSQSIGQSITKKNITSTRSNGIVSQKHDDSPSDSESSSSFMSGQKNTPPPTIKPRRYQHTAVKDALCSTNTHTIEGECLTMPDFSGSARTFPRELEPYLPGKFVSSPSRQVTGFIEDTIQPGVELTEAGTSILTPQTLLDTVKRTHLYTDLPVQLFLTPPSDINGWEPGIPAPLSPNIIVEWDTNDAGVNEDEKDNNV